MRPSRPVRIALHFANLVTIAFFLLPIITAVIGSFESEKTLRADTRAVLPSEWTLDNFRVLLSGGAPSSGSIYDQATYLPDNVKKIRYALANSTIIAVSVTILTLVFGSLSALTVARLRFRWLGWLMNINVFARFVPVIVLMIPLYMTFRRLDLLNSVWGVIIAETGFLLPYGVLILAPYFAALPHELDEAARIDGCGHVRVLFQILLPQIKPAIATVTVFAFIGSWNNLLGPLIYLRDQSKYTMPLGLQLFVSSQYVTKYNQMMAIALLMLIPVVVLFLIAQRSFVRGITLTGMGGR
jgi:multiple sugar transport system permease protein